MYDHDRRTMHHAVHGAMVHMAMHDAVVHRVMHYDHTARLRHRECRQGQGGHDQYGRNQLLHKTP
jgi:hypothetical protein